DLVAASAEDLDPELADRTRADDEYASARHRLRRADDARERFDPDAGERVERFRQRDEVRCAEPLGESAGLDPHVCERATRRLMTRAATLAVAARHAVHDRHASPVGRRADDLVAEHGACRAAPELLDVRAAQAAGEDVHELPR